MKEKTKQQQQTLSFFNQNANDWRLKAEGKKQFKFSVIGARNAYVLSCATENRKVKHALDVGCGTGELVCDMAKAGIKAVGIDFAPDMIKLCNQKKETEGASKAEFLCMSFFDYNPDSKTLFDQVSANGFIEYISLQELGNFLTHCTEIIRPGGTLILGSRNRLYNLLSLNEFTKNEMDLGATDLLTQEALTLTQTTDREQLLDTLRHLPVNMSQMEKHPPTTGIEIAVRYQFTPAELIQMTEKFGFRATDVYAVHYQGLHPSLKNQYPEIHFSIANHMQELAKNHFSLLPYASTFMLKLELK